MPKARTAIIFAQFAAVMDHLGSDMDNISISPAPATNGSVAVDKLQTSSDDQAGSRPDTSMIETSVESGKDVLEVSTGKNIISADDAVDFSVQVAEVNEYRVCRSLMGTRLMYLLTTNSTYTSGR